MGVLDGGRDSSYSIGMYHVFFGSCSPEAALLRITEDTVRSPDRVACKSIPLNLKHKFSPNS